MQFSPFSSSSITSFWQLPFVFSSVDDHVIASKFIEEYLTHFDQFFFLLPDNALQINPVNFCRLGSGLSRPSCGCQGCLAPERTSYLSCWFHHVFQGQAAPKLFVVHQPLSLFLVWDCWCPKTPDRCPARNSKRLMVTRSTFIYCDILTSVLLIPVCFRQQLFDSLRNISYPSRRDCWFQPLCLTAPGCSGDHLGSWVRPLPEVSEALASFSPRGFPYRLPLFPHIDPGILGPAASFKWMFSFAHSGGQVLLLARGLADCGHFCHLSCQIFISRLDFLFWCPRCSHFWQWVPIYFFVSCL